MVFELELNSFLEEISWGQKSRILWFKEGDKCTEFFDQMLISDRRNNAIQFLHDGENILSRQEAIKDHVVSFYWQLFKEDFSWRPKLDGLHFDSIDQISTAG